MANTLSAKKRIRQNAKRSQRNRVYRSQARSFIKKAHVAIESGETEAATEAVKMAISQLDRAVSKGVIHSKNGARRKSRLMKRLAGLEKPS